VAHEISIEGSKLFKPGLKPGLGYIAAAAPPILVTFRSPILGQGSGICQAGRDGRLACGHRAQMVERWRHRGANDEPALSWPFPWLTPGRAQKQQLSLRPLWRPLLLWVCIDRNLARRCRAHVNVIKTHGIRGDDLDGRRNSLKEVGIEPVERHDKNCIRALSRSKPVRPVVCFAGAQDEVSSRVNGLPVAFRRGLEFAFDPCFYRLEKTRCNDQDWLLHEIGSPDKGTFRDCSIDLEPDQAAAIGLLFDLR
jgi:hypothetical protein